MNLDHNQFFSNQRDPAENDDNECVGLTIADILGNALGVPLDPDFPYSLGFYLRSLTPQDTGVDPYAAFLSTVAYGILPTSLETWTARTTSELFAANFLNFNAEQKAAAQQYAQNGVKTLYSFDDITTYLLQYRMGAGLAVRWYEIFNTPCADGTLPMPGLNDSFSEHCVAVYENTDKGLRIKSWQGTVGDGGYLYMPQKVFDRCFQESYGFRPDSWRWLSLVYIALLFPNRIPDILPQLSASAKIR